MERRLADLLRSSILALANALSMRALDLLDDTHHVRVVLWMTPPELVTRLHMAERVPGRILGGQVSFLC